MLPISLSSSMIYSGCLSGGGVTEMKHISRRVMLKAAGLAGVGAVGISQPVVAADPPVSISGWIHQSQVTHDDYVQATIQTEGGVPWRITFRNLDGPGGLWHGLWGWDACPIPYSDEQTISYRMPRNPSTGESQLGTWELRVNALIGCEEGEERIEWPPAVPGADHILIGTFEVVESLPSDPEPDEPLVRYAVSSDLHPRFDVVRFSRDDDGADVATVTLTRTAHPADGRVRTLELEPGAENVQMAFPPQQHGTWAVSVDPGSLAEGVEPSLVIPID